MGGVSDCTYKAWEGDGLKPHCSLHAPVAAGAAGRGAGFAAWLAGLGPAGAAGSPAAGASAAGASAAGSPAAAWPASRACTASRTAASKLAAAAACLAWRSCARRATVLASPRSDSTVSAGFSPAPGGGGARSCTTAGWRCSAGWPRLALGAAWAAFRGASAGAATEGSPAGPPEGSGPGLAGASPTSSGLHEQERERERESGGGHGWGSHAMPAARPTCRGAGTACAAPLLPKRCLHGGSSTSPGTTQGCPWQPKPTHPSCGRSMPASTSCRGAGGRACRCMAWRGTARHGAA